MYIARQTPQELVVEDNSFWLAYVCAALAVVIIFFSIALNKINCLFGASLFLLLAMIARRRLTFTFDAMQRIVRWRSEKHFKLDTGVILFDNITGIGTEAWDSDSGTCFRLTILTRESSIPMAYTYTGRLDEYAPMRQQILDFIKPQSYMASPPSGIQKS